MIKEKTLNKIIDLLESIKLSESFSTMRHVPTEYTLTLKRKLRNHLNQLTLDDIITLSVWVELGKEMPSKEHLKTFEAQLSRRLNYKSNKEDLIDQLIRQEGLVDYLLKGKHLQDNS